MFYWITFSIFSIQTTGGIWETLLLLTWIDFSRRWFRSIITDYSRKNLGSICFFIANWREKKLGTWYPNRTSIKLHLCMRNDDLFKLYCMVLLTFGGFFVKFSRIIMNLEVYSTKNTNNFYQLKSTLTNKIKILHTQCRFLIYYFSLGVDMQP